MVKRKLYVPGLEKYGLVTLLKEAYAMDSRILRLNRETEKCMYIPNERNFETLHSVRDESKSIRRRIKSAKLADNQSKEAVLKRLKKHGRIVFLSLGLLQEAIDSGIYSNYELEESIYILNCSREDVFRPEGSPYIDKYKSKKKFCNLSKFESSLLLRAEEFNRCIFWRDVKKFSAIGEIFSQIVDPVTGKNYNNFKKVLKPFFWNKWGKEYDNKPKFTNSRNKVVSNFTSGSFDLRPVAELVYHANPTVRMGMLLPFREEQRRKREKKLGNI